MVRNSRNAAEEALLRTSAKQSDHFGLYRIGQYVDLTEDERKHLDSLETDRIFIEKKQTIFTGQKSYNHLIVIESGWAKQQQMLSDGRTQIFNFFVPGDVIGMQHCFSDDTETDIRSVSPISATVIPFSEISGTIEKFPRLAMGLLGMRNQEITKLQAHVLSLGRRSALEATLHLFLELQERLKQVGLANGHYTIPINQNDIADYLGLSIVHVNRTLQQLRQKQLITLQRREITISAQIEAELLAEFDGGYLEGEEL